jgi:ABC-2 type transport system permease protein
MSPVTTQPETPGAPAAPEAEAGAVAAMRPITGPTALGTDPRRFWHLTRALAITEFKLRFFGSALGYLWTLMRPLLLFGVLYVVFTEVVRFGGGVDHYPVYLLMAIVLFTYFSETTSRGVTSLVERENLLRKMRFPRMVIPLSVALHALFNLGLNLVVVFIFVLGSGIKPRVEWLELLPLVALLVVFASGVTMLLSALYVRYRDILPIWEVSLQILFYASPVIYVTSTLPDSVEREAMANPITAILTQARYALIDPDAPTAAEAIGGSARLLIPLFVVVAVSALGFWVFTRQAPRIAEEL